MLKQLLLLTVILLGINSKCSSGCSKCVKDDSEYKCEICDLSRFYFLNDDGECEEKVLLNCKIPSPSSTSKMCVECKPEHFFDELAQECVGVPVSRKDENCSVYSLVADCLKCNEGHIVQSGKCVVPTNVISNCKWQVSEEHCQICKSGYQLNVARTTCMSFSTVNNCQQHQEFACSRCKSDYTLAFNWHLLSRISLSNLQSSLMGELDMAIALDSAKEDCVKKSISKCKDYDSYGRCSKCESSYHVDPISGKCVLSREPEIFKCKKYSNMTTCAECSHGFYLSGNKCVERTIIENCEVYSVGSDGCDECVSGYYSATSSCNLRNASANINYCKEYEKKQDKCASCEEGFFQSSDKLKCFEPIPYCNGYNDTLSTATLTCTGCKPEAIPEKNTADPPQIINCVKRDNQGCVSWSADNSNECATCLKNVYWKHTDHTCKKYTKKCKTYALDSDNCASCFKDSYLDNSDPADVKCVAYTVKNCDDFEENKNECKDCKANYFKDKNTKDCHPYTLINCQDEKSDENICNNCKTGFYKVDDVTCLPKDLWECKEPEDTNECKTCNQGFYKVNGKCYAGTQVGCTKDKYVENMNQCSECVKGYYLDTNKNCLPYTVSNCKGSTNDGFVVNKDECEGCLPGFFLDSNKKCQKILIPNCLEADTAGTTCNTCETGFYKSGSNCKVQYISHCKTYKSAVNECSECFQGFYLSSSDTVCARVEISNCKEYETSAATCKTCKNGFNKKTDGSACVAEDIPGCTSYSDGLCSGFQTNYYYNDSGTIKPRASQYCLKALTSNTSIDSCETCVAGFKKVNQSGVDVCKKNPVTNCGKYDSSGTCTFCKTGYYDNNGACQAISTLTKCIKQKENENKCSLCEPGKGLTTGDCSDNSSDTTVLNCRGNSAASNTEEGCNTCFFGSSKIAIAADSLTRANGPGVLSKNATGAITMLEEGYEMKNGKIVFGPTDSKCLQLSLGLYSTGNKLFESDNCSKCRYPSLHYIKVGATTICDDRTVKNCGVFTLNADTCIACEEGLAYAGDSVNNTCNEAKDNVGTNCKYTNSGSPGCYECYQGHAVDSSTIKCVVTSDKGCRIVNNAAPAECNTCKEGWYLNKTTKKCQKPDTCITEDAGGQIGTFCKYCLPGFKPDSTTLYTCIPSTPDDVCSMYENLDNDVSPKQSRCVKCKDPTMIPVNKFDTDKYKFRCVPNKYSELSQSFLVDSGSGVSIKSIIYSGSGYSTATNLKIGSISSPSHVCQSLEVPFCKVYDFTNVYAPCTKCEDGYYLVPNSKNGQTCEKGGIGGCLEYASRKSCNVCEAQWLIKTNGDNNKYCEPYEKIEYCEVHSGNSSVCLQCTPGYLLHEDQCIEQEHTNCKYYLFGENVCLGCEDNYYLKNNKCFPHTNTNCKKLSRSDDICVECNSNYYLKKGGCYLNTSINCKIKSKLDNICLSCEEGYYLEKTSSLCIANESNNCWLPDPESRDCLVCEEGYFLHNGICLLYTIQNCAVRDSGMDRCEYCQEGFYLNKWGSCGQYNVKNCQVKDPNANACIQCKEGFYVSSNKTCYQYTVKSCSVYNYYKNECLSCLPGHYKDSTNNCVKYTNTENCETVDPSSDKCVSCNPGYYIDFGVCVQYTVKNCALYKSDANLCVTCEDGYFILGNTCVPYTLRCEQYNPVANTCLTCPEGYYLDDGLCYVNNGLFCKEWSPFRNGCKSCVDGFYLNLKTGQCRLREKSTNCKEVIETGDLCLSCFDTHYIAGGICISYSRATCKKFDLKKDLCMECETNKYWMSHHVCEEYTVTNCKTFDPKADKCQVCETGKWYLDSQNGVCLESTPVEHCEGYSNSANECTSCEDGYYLVSGSECRRNPTGLFKCIEYQDENTCIKCELGFYVDNNYCQKSKVVIDKCINYIGEGKCEGCEATHLLSEDKCVEKVETSCATWADAENCVTCPTNQVLKDNDESKKVCVDSELSDCVEAKFATPTNQCIKCADKKILVNDACQDPVSPLTGCKVYVKEGECSECEDGFTLTKSANGCVSNYSLMSSNCAFGIEKSDPVCRVCMGGHHLDENRNCVSCGGDGCDVCDPYDSTKCLFCKPGFDHNGSSCSATAVVNRLASDGSSDDEPRHFNFVGRFEGLLILLGSFFSALLIL